jgi:predicted GNAT family N-acyltransferase
MIVGIDYEVRVPDTAELDAVQQLRHAVLDPAKLVSTELQLGPKDFDPRTIHVAAFAGERVVSTVRLDPQDEGVYSVRKMATAEDYRGRGIGRSVLSYAETLAWMQGARVFTLDSRESAIPFYTRLGYLYTGKEVMHTDGIPNYTMLKKVGGNNGR